MDVRDVYCISAREEGLKNSICLRTFDMIVQGLTLWMQPRLSFARIIGFLLTTRILDVFCESAISFLSILIFVKKISLFPSKG